MADDVFALFDDFAARYARGERPDARAYLARAGEGADELAGLMDAFLVRASPPSPDEDVRAAAASWIEGRAPLLELRTRRGLRRDEVVDALVGSLRLDPKKRQKVKRYYHELEAGQLDPRRVDPSVLEGLAAALSARVADLLAWRPRPPEPAMTFYRLAEPRAVEAASVPARESEEPDEIDRLFGRS